MIDKFETHAQYLKSKNRGKINLGDFAWKFSTCIHQHNEPSSRHILTPATLLLPLLIKGNHLRRFGCEEFDFGAKSWLKHGTRGWYSLQLGLIKKLIK